MAGELRHYFEQAEHLGGFAARRRLAVLTGLTSVEAANQDATPDKVNRFDGALRTLEREFNRSSRETLFNELLRAPPRGQALVETLRRQSQLVADFLSQRPLFWSDINLCAERLTEAASTGLHVARVSVWLFESDGNSIECQDVFDEHQGSHNAGLRVHNTQHPLYFKALGEARTLSAPDAVYDPRTSEFAHDYLLPLGITSLLDVPIWTAQKMIGILCCEHRGQIRVWSVDDETFAYTVAALFALAFEQHALATKNNP